MRALPIVLIALAICAAAGGISRQGALGHSTWRVGPAPRADATEVQYLHATSSILTLGDGGVVRVVTERGRVAGRT